MRVLFLIRSLALGGAEQQLVALAKGLLAAGHHPAVAIFYEGGELQDVVAASGIPVLPLEKSGRWDLSLFRRFLRRHAEFRPDVIHTYLPTSNEIGVALKPFLHGTPVVWGVRSAFMDVSRYGLLSRLSYAIEPMLSHAADGVIVNSECARAHAERIGFRKDTLSVVPNGFNCAHYAPDRDGRARLRARWGVSNADFVVGLVGRLDPMKDHDNFLRAAAIVAGRQRNCVFVCVGGGEPDYKNNLMELAATLNIAGRMIWEPKMKDTRAAYSAFDVFVLSSYGESFPNVVAEAMACGTPCIVTNVGDAAIIVGDVGVVVPPKDPGALARAVENLIQLPPEQRQSLGARSRERIESEYSIDLLVSRTVAVLERAIS